MLKNLFQILVFIFFLAPLWTLVHELGHAIIPMLNREKVKISIGQTSILNFEIKNFSLNIGKLKPWIGYTSWSGESTIGRLALGPLMSLLLGCLFYYLSSQTLITTMY